MIILKYDLELIIEENIMIYTRDLTSDYNFTYKNNNIDSFTETRFISLGNDSLHEIDSTENISSWKIFRQENGVIFIRAIITNDIDMFSRIIYRFEGVFLTYNTFYKYSEDVIINTLENVLESILNNNTEDNKYLNAAIQEINTPELTSIGELFKDEFGQLWVNKNGNYYKLVDFAGNHLMEENSLKREKNKL